MLNPLNNISPNAGHRKRLKLRFKQSPIRVMADYEILEMLLFNCFPRIDTKPLAKKLLSTFNSLRNVLTAEENLLREVEGVTEGVIFQFKLLLDVSSRLELGVGEKIHVLSNWSAVLNYCRLTMGFQSFESFRVLFLNKKNILIRDEVLQVGTIDKVIVYPREVAKKALDYAATAIILVHNHPSGDMNPSSDDIEITDRIIQVLKSLGITVHDHLIVSKDQVFSFRNAGMIS